jgi:hypothetical protein
MKMAGQAPTLTRHDLEAKIVKRCWEDEAFRGEFIADPAGVFVKYWAAPAASLPKIVIHEESSGSWHIVLPPRPANAGELSEEELERVAGGRNTTVLCSFAYITAMYSVTGTIVSAGETSKQGW